MHQRFSRFKTSAIPENQRQAFQQHIESQAGHIDPDVEGYTRSEVDRQRDLSVKFHWGHDHDFGDFRMSGRMGDRHLHVMAHFMTLFGCKPSDFHQATVLDVGCWTGGTTLLLSTMCKQVHALEEVHKYAKMAQFLVDSFGLANQVSVEAKSLYECDTAGFRNRFDVVHFPGVIYHLSDPVLALRILFNSLRQGGFMLIESKGLDSDEPTCEFEGNFIYHTGTEEEKSRGGWNWFVPSPVALQRMMREAGFEDIRTCYVTGVDRVYGFGRKIRENPICRAGLSVRSIP
ncbi:MAG TPA: DUF1698 domain-containing protein [Verrucomicrobiae bacterium]